MSEPSRPSSPAAVVDPSAGWWRGVWRASLRTHGLRAAVVAALLTLGGAVVSVALAVVGWTTCHVEGSTEMCREVHFHPFTLQPRSEVNLKDGVPHGVRREWHVGGAVWFEGSYIDGLRAGAWREHYPDGTLRFEGAYKNDALDGLETWFYPNGAREWQVGRLIGKRDGEERWWHDNGALRRVGAYVRGERSGTFTVYDEAGRVAFTGEYRRGERIAGAQVD